MLKNVLLLIITICYIDCISQEIYNVIKVDGEIIYIKNKKNLTTGDAIGLKEALNYLTPDAKAIIINKNKGRVILTPSTTKKNENNFLPAMNNISSRAGALINLIDLTNHFSGKYLIIEKVKIAISTDIFPMDENHFFYIQYTYQGQDINKKMTNIRDTLHIVRDSLFVVDGLPIPGPDMPEMKLWYRNNKKNESVFINSFIPVFPDIKSLYNEVKIILNEYKNENFDTKFNEVVSYLNEQYGKPQRENLLSWLKINFSF